MGGREAERERKERARASARARARARQRETGQTEIYDTVNSSMRDSVLSASQSE